MREQQDTSNQRASNLGTEPAAPQPSRQVT